jgi:long-chain acyl-CoA synthetase
LRNNLGFSRVRVAYTAGEAIGPDLFNFYRAIGINLKQLYGSTETAVFVCLQPDNEARSDTVGIPCAGVEIKVSEQGEVLVKSAGLLKGYYKNPEATAEVLTADGWYHTNDAGFIDNHGHLKIIDRVKDVGRIARWCQRRCHVCAQVCGKQTEVFPAHQRSGGLRRWARQSVRDAQHRF